MMDFDDEILPEARIFNRRATNIIQSKCEAYEQMFTKYNEEKLAESVESEQNDILLKIEEKLKKKPKAKKGKKAKVESVEEKTSPSRATRRSKRTKVTENNGKEDDDKKEKSETPIKFPAAAKKRMKELELQTMRETKRMDEETEKILSSCSSKLWNSPSSTSSTVPQDVSVRFRYMSEVAKLSVNENEKFATIFAKVADLFNLKASEILLCIEDRNVQIDDSPLSLNLKFCDIIDCIPYKGVETAEDEHSINKLLIRIQSSDSRKKIDMNTHKLEKFHDIMTRYSALRNIPLKDLIFEFDGEEIEDDQTPEDLDMESGSCIDVKVLSVLPQPEKKSSSCNRMYSSVVDLSDDEWQPVSSNEMLQICELDSD